MSAKRKTNFDKFLTEQLKSPAVAKAYTQARAELAVIDQLVRALDDARIELGLSKAELARRIASKPEVVRRLFTSDDPNPTLETVVKLAAALGYRLQVVRAERKRPVSKRRAA